jgi:hypothetical protein
LKSTQFANPIVLLASLYRARRQMAMGQAGQLWDYVEGMYVQNMNHNILCVCMYNAVRALYVCCMCVYSCITPCVRVLYVCVYMYNAVRACVSL